MYCFVLFAAHLVMILIVSIMLAALSQSKTAQICARSPSVLGWMCYGLLGITKQYRVGRMSYLVVFMSALGLTGSGCNNPNSTKCVHAKHAYDKRDIDAGTKEYTIDTNELKCKNKSSVSIKQESPLYGATLVVETRLSCGNGLNRNYDRRDGAHDVVSETAKNRTELLLSICAILRKGKSDIFIPSYPFVFYEQTCRINHQGRLMGPCDAELSDNLRYRKPSNLLTNDIKRIRVFRKTIFEGYAQEVLLMMSSLDVCGGRRQKGEVLGSVMVLPVTKGVYRIRQKLFRKYCTNSP